MTRGTRILTVLSLLGSSAHGVVAQTNAIEPGDVRLHPARVRLATDTIVVLVTPKGGVERTAATLVRNLVRAESADGPLFQETQRYVYGAGETEVDTLEVSARTLALLRIVEVSTRTRNELSVARGRMVGIVSPTDSTVADVDIARPAAFHDMMLEAFIGAFPLDPGSVLSIPTLRPPSTDIRIVDVEVSPRTETLHTAGGAVECVVVERRGRSVTTWLSRADGHIVRMRWTNADGSTTWKLPAADVLFR